MSEIRKPGAIKNGGITWAACESSSRFNQVRTIFIGGIREPSNGMSLEVCKRLLKWLPKAIAWRNEGEL
jgi:hypothetical protein